MLIFIGLAVGNVIFSKAGIMSESMDILDVTFYQGVAIFLYSQFGQKKPHKV